VGAACSREALGNELGQAGRFIAYERTLLPDVLDLLAAAEQLVATAFTVLPYTDRRAGAGPASVSGGLRCVHAAVPAPIGSGLGNQ